MLDVRCDSCGEPIEEIWFQPVFIAFNRYGGHENIVPMPAWKRRDYAVCESCVKEFVGGKMHAAATTEKV